MSELIFISLTPCFHSVSNGCSAQVKWAPLALFQRQVCLSDVMQRILQTSSFFKEAYFIYAVCLISSNMSLNTLQERFLMGQKKKAILIFSQLWQKMAKRVNKKKKRQNIMEIEKLNTFCSLLLFEVLKWLSSIFGFLKFLLLTFADASD